MDVSILIPIYNQAGFLKEAVDSIAVPSSWKSEIVIVNDGSTDGVLEVLPHLKGNIRFYSTKHLGVSAARNRALKEATGDWIAFLDADDRFTPSKFQRLPNGDIVMGKLRYLGENESPFFCASLGGALIRREVFAEIGAFDPNLAYSEDLDWMLRAKDAGIEVEKTDAVVYEYRKHEKNSTKEKLPKELLITNVLKRSIDRRQKPLVSVVIPVFNGELYLKQAIESVLHQSYPHLEILVIDDGSTDASASIAKAFPTIRYFSQENSGNALARMRGIEEAKGQYIAFLDQDDLWERNKLERQMQAHLSDPDLECSTGRVRYFLESEHVEFKRELLGKEISSFLPGTIVAKKSLFRRFPFDPFYRKGSDSDWFFRLREARVKHRILPDLLLHVRIHANNLSHEEKGPVNHDLFQLMKASIARKQQDLPLISVVIPVYNSESYLKEAIESVLTQAYPAIELIVVDDGSTDGSRQAILNYGLKLRYVWQKNQGIGAARNRGIAMAEGQYLAFLDADDRWSPTKLEEQMELLVKDPHLDMVFGQVEHFFSPEKEDTLKAMYKLPEAKQRGVFAGNLLIKRETWEKVGDYNPTLKVGEFIDWYARAKRSGLTEATLPSTLLYRRIHGKNTSIEKTSIQKDYLRILREKIQHAST